MKPDPNHDGIGVGPFPEPEPGTCPSCEVDMEVVDEINATSETFITSFKCECPDCGTRWLDSAGD